MIITIAHTKGGVGKSLISFHLAVALKAAVIDLDFQQTIIIRATCKFKHYKQLIFPHNNFLRLKKSL